MINAHPVGRVLHVDLRGRGYLGLERGSLGIGWLPLPLGLRKWRAIALGKRVRRRIRRGVKTRGWRLAWHAELGRNWWDSRVAPWEVRPRLGLWDCGVPRCNRLLLPDCLGEWRSALHGSPSRTPRLLLGWDIPLSRGLLPASWWLTVNWIRWCAGMNRRVRHGRCPVVGWLAGHGWERVGPYVLSRLNPASVLRRYACYMLRVGNLSGREDWGG